MVAYHRSFAREARGRDYPLLRNLPENLRWHRRIRDLRQASLATLSGFKQQYISALERGLRPSDPRHVEVLAQALGISPTALLRRRRSAPHTPTSPPVVPQGSSLPEREP